MGLDRPGPSQQTTGRRLGYNLGYNGYPPKREKKKRERESAFTPAFACTSIRHRKNQFVKLSSTCNLSVLAQLFKGESSCPSQVSRYCCKVKALNVLMNWPPRYASGRGNGAAGISKIDVTCERERKRVSVACCTKVRVSRKVRWINNKRRHLHNRFKPTPPQ